MNQYIGEIRIFLRHNMPRGYLLCNGQELFINEYPRLYMAVGCRFGGDEKTRFNLPNMRYDHANIVYCLSLIHI